MTRRSRVISSSAKVSFTVSRKIRVGSVEVGGDANSAWHLLYQHLGDKYDLLGFVGFIFRILGHEKSRWVCSEAVAAMIGVPDAWRFDPCSLHAAVSVLCAIDDARHAQGVA